MSKFEEVKALVKNKFEELKSQGVDIKISYVYNKYATEHGYSNWKPVLPH